MSNLFNQKRVLGGFTLVELMTAILIVGVLVAVGMPFYSAYINKAKTAEAYMIINAIEKAQEATLLEHGQFVGSLHFSPAGDSSDILPPRGSKSPLLVNNGWDMSASQYEYYKPFYSIIPDGTAYYFTYAAHSGMVVGSVEEMIELTPSDRSALFFIPSGEWVQPISVNFTAADPANPSDDLTCGKMMDFDLPERLEHFSVTFAGSIADGNTCSIVLSVMKTNGGKIVRQPPISFELDLGPPAPK